MSDKLTVFRREKVPDLQPLVSGRSRLLVRVAQWLWLGRSWNQLLWLAVVVLLLYTVVPGRSLAISVLIYGMWAASLNLLVGYGQLVSFGHALYFEIGSYAVGLFLLHVMSSTWLGLLVAIALGGMAAAFTGVVCLRRRTLYFAMLTLAFAQLGYFVALKATSLTGGANGLTNVPAPPLRLPGLTVSLDSIRQPTTFFWVTASILFVVFAVMILYTESPLGRALIAAGDNEERAQGCGYNTQLVYLVTFIFAGMVAGLAGGINAIFDGVVGLQQYWLLSGLVLIMVLVGGRDSLFGGLLGAALYEVGQHYLSDVTQAWEVFLGGIFVLIVLAFPEGLWGLVRGRQTTRLRSLRSVLGLRSSPAVK